ncbi:hypothetical protein [Agromyces laixinhei]|uniref:hypothetical protein n=1 Tax=Agromyces laixinhei TaxID=2585717 RepID=UPI0012ED923A|nr:hypothetical protein [Agromyces laixinhei]
MTSSTASRRPAWLITLIVAGVIAGVAVAGALIFGSVHTLTITAVLMVPLLLLAGLLYLVEQVARRAAN